MQVDSQPNIKLNPLVFAVLVILPLAMIAYAIMYGVHYGISSFEIVLFVVGYYGSNISVGLGLHRLWTHHSYKVNKVVEFFLALVAAGTLQGPALVWASDHYKHHAFTDDEEDPHSPLKYKNPIKGFFWAHIGWMIYGTGPSKTIDRITMAKIGKNKILRWQMKYYWQIATFMNTIAPALVGYAFMHNLQGALAGFVFIGLARALQQQATFCVNSLTHFVGSKPYYNGTAGNIWWMAPFLLGENYHNFHHAFGSDYRNGEKWYHLDVHKWLIAMLEKLGLATNLVRTSDARIQAKVEATRQEVAKHVREDLSLIEAAAEMIAAAAREKLDCAGALANRMHGKILTLQIKAQSLAKMSQEALASAENLSKNIGHKYREQLRKLEHLANKLGIALPA